jgi:NTE family protein
MRIASPTAPPQLAKSFFPEWLGRSKPRSRSLSLALQGGGAHGAFTWGVLDRLLEHREIEIDGLSGASAGAMNAVVMASGFLNGGRDGARATLARFWRQVADAALFSPLRPNLAHQLIEMLVPGWSPPKMAFDLVTRIFSPYQFNPLDINPLRPILAEHVDFGQLRASTAPRLFVSATHVGTGQARIFANSELSLDVLVASACLPVLHQAVVIDGESYWDGGYSNNPPLLPLIEHCGADDVLLVRINRPESIAAPVNSPDIFQRVNHIVFNASLENELKSLDLARRIADEGIAVGGVLRGKMRRLKLHQIDAADALRALGGSNSLNPDWAMISKLRDEGRAAAESWLEKRPV